MSESTRDGAQVHTRGEQFGRGVVPELLEHRVDAQLGHQPAVAACERRRVTRLAHVRLRGEHPRAVAQGDAQQRKARSTILAVLPQQGHRRRVDRHPPHLVRLGVLEQHPVGGSHVVLVQSHNASGEVDVLPLQGHNFTAPRTEHCRHPDVDLVYSRRSL
jgi:hypothetical protein